MRYCHGERSRATNQQQKHNPMPITFQAADIKLPSLKKTALKKFLSAQSKKKLHVGYVFCSDEFLLNMNQQFLGHDFYTDIITFPLSETDKEIEAEIYISVDRVNDNAAKLKVDFSEEMHRVIFHGILHLMGFKDKSKTDKETMRRKENEWLRKFKGGLKGA
jgi:probable rRNA maturation factor